ncbi:PLDc N-terminal domain-containing protein [Burkholderia sp. LFS038]|uniref:PLDc N-terminal domain-containing protein n=1 Tax=Burkholderia sp. LFS038 TaxID=3229884 RepID=UPI003A810BAA
MELWQWALVILGGASAIFVLGAIVWGIWDVLGDPRVDPAFRIVWVLVMAFVPLFGIVAWLYAKPKLSRPF